MNIDEKRRIECADTSHASYVLVLAQLKGKTPINGAETAWRKALAHSPLPHFLQLDRIVLLAEPAKMAQNMNN
jgi:hypothetical protein